MSKQNHTQKQWALTACLAAVLSFNFILGSQGVPFSSADFASEEEKSVAGENTDKDTEISEPKFASIITEDGKFKIKYIKKDEETIAIIPKQVEGGFCWDKCGKKLILPANFESSKDDLELAFRKALAASKVEEVEDDPTTEKKASKPGRTKVTEVAENDDQDEVEKEEEEEEEKPDKHLLALEKKCDKKEEDSRTECFANGLTRLLKDKKKDLPREQVLALYRKEIEPGLIDALSSVRDEDRRENALVIVEDMLGSVAKKYNYLRERLVKLSAMAVIKAQQTAQKRFRQAEQMKNTNPYQALRLQAEGFNRRSYAESLAMNLDYTLQSGLESAQFNRLIDENRVVDLYTNQYVDIVNPIIQGMRQNPLGYTISSSLIADGTGLVLDGVGTTVVDPSLGPISELRTLGRGVQVIGNGLTPANTVPANAPLIVTTNGANTPGTAVIQVIPANQIPTNLNQMGIRGRN